MKIQYMYLVIGLMGGVALCSLFPKIPIGIRNYVDKYKKQQKEKKNAKK